MQSEDFDKGYAEGYENGYNGIISFLTKDRTNSNIKDSNNNTMIYQIGFNIGHVNGIYNAKKDGFIIGFSFT